MVGLARTLILKTRFRRIIFNIFNISVRACIKKPLVYNEPVRIIKVKGPPNAQATAWQGRN